MERERKRKVRMNTKISKNEKKLGNAYTWRVSSVTEYRLPVRDS
jgi:hypothetical protein